ncbi:monovalent cation/H(+) antiporter subunit G [Streptomyces sp. SBR177]
MEVRPVCAAVLLTAGVAVLLLAVLALHVLPGPYVRLHALAPASSLGAPLVVLAVAVAEGRAGGRSGCSWWRCSWWSGAR